MRILARAEYIFSAYLVFAGLAQLVLTVLGKTSLSKRKIQPRRADTSQLLREMGWSAASSLVFSAEVELLHVLRDAGLTRALPQGGHGGAAALVLNTAALLVIQDAWFYWTHRLLHRPWLFRHVHRTHHLSRSPTAFAAFSFHPVEAAVQFGYLPIAVLLLPLERVSIDASLLIMLTMNVMGHCGYELYPRTFSSHWLGRWFTTSTHHNRHHAKIRGNYALYFTLWDRFASTLRDESAPLADASTADPQKTAA